MAEPEFAPTIDNILKQESLRWIFVGGKGGVGKTTTSSSIALQLAAVRPSVLIISTDPAHNLSDAFGQKFTSAPTQIKGVSNLYAMEVDPKPEKLDMDGLSDEDGGFLKDLVSSIPGIDEAMSFAEVMKLVKTMDYHTIVFDTAPTGHTLRLLQFPTTLEKGLGKLQQLQGTIAPMMGMMGNMMGGGAGPPPDLFGQMSELQATVADVNKQFQDPEMTTFVCVCIPEFLSLYETERLVQELANQHIDVHNIIINQVIYQGPTDFSPLLAARVRMQAKYMEQFDELYGEDMHIITMPLLQEEVRGVERLQEFSNLLSTPYQVPTPPSFDPYAKIAELEAELSKLKQ